MTTMSRDVVPDGGQRLPTGHSSLAYGVRWPVPGALSALAVTGGITMPPKPGRTIYFGRNRPDVHVCIGEDDLRVSRQHGMVTHRDGTWWIANTGHQPVRLPNSVILHNDSEPVPLGPGYTPLFVTGTGPREHLLELYVTGQDTPAPGPGHRDPTDGPRYWRLTPDERLILVVLGQRYLLNGSNPQPLTWRQAAGLLSRLRPDSRWTWRRVAHKVNDVRRRLSDAGVRGLRKEEVPEPIGNQLNDNLLRELVLSTTLVPPDLAMLDEPPR